MGGVVRARIPLPLLTAALALAGALLATVFFYFEANRAVSTMLDQRLTGAGTAAALLIGTAPDPERLRALMGAESLDGAFLVDRQLRVLADTNGPIGQSADLLRIDPERVAAAFAGSPSIGSSYEVERVAIRTGYFPVRAEGAIIAVLGLEAGAGFAGASSQLLGRALAISVLLSILGAGALAIVATRQVRTERARQLALARAGRAELLTQIAAAAAHEIRNPLGVIRGTVELMQERSGPNLTERDQAALTDVLSEVARLKRLTEDLLDLSAARALLMGPVTLEGLLRETVDAARATSPTTRIELACPQLPEIQADAARLRQVFFNILQNAIQAAPTGTVRVTGLLEAQGVKVAIADEGPGISPEIAARLFEPFFTGRAGGTGLGLALSRRFVEQHGGTLVGFDSGKGATFEVALPKGTALTASR